MLQLSIDTEADFSLIEAIMTAAGGRAARLDLEEIIELAESLRDEVSG